MTLPNVAHHAILDELQHVNPEGLWYDTRFVRLEFDGGRVTGLEAERQGHPVHITARLVVGADGALSNVRQSLGIAAEMYLYPEAYLIAILDSGSEVTEAKYFVGNRSILGMFPAAGRKVYLFYMIPAGSFEQVKAAGFEPLRAAWTRIDPSGSRSSGIWPTGLKQRTCRPAG